LVLRSLPAEVALDNDREKAVTRFVLGANTSQAVKAAKSPKAAAPPVPAAPPAPTPPAAPKPVDDEDEGGAYGLVEAASNPPMPAVLKSRSIDEPSTACNRTHMN